MVENLVPLDWTSERVRARVDERRVCPVVELPVRTFCHLRCSPERGPWELGLYLTESCLRAVRRTRFGASPDLATTLLDLRHGHHSAGERSAGGRDGTSNVTAASERRNRMVARLHAGDLGPPRGPAELATFLADLDRNRRG